MSKVISVDEKGVIYIENNRGEVFGVVSSLIVTDGNGAKYENDTLTVLEENDFELNQDWENETTYIEFREENGEASRVVFSGDEASYIGHDELFNE